MLQRALLFLFLLCCLAACDFGGSPATPTPLAVATDTPLPPLALATLTSPPPAASDTPAPTSTAVPTLTSAPTPTTAQAPTEAATPTSGSASPAATASEATTPAPTGTARTASSPEAAPSPATLQQLTAIETQTAKLRGLQPKTPVPAHFISHAQMAANLKDQIEKEYPREDARRDALELWLLRLLPDRNIDLYQTQIDLLGEQVIGYYSPDDKELFVLADKQPLDPQAKSTLAHEFTHALQDQYFDLNKLRPEDLHDNDRGSALTALIEGDALFTEVYWDSRNLSQAEFQQLIQQSGNAPSSALDQAPPYIRDSLLFPYSQGIEFVTTLYQQGGYSFVNQAFRDPPTSTEQILHPDRYLATPRDTPIPISLPPLTSTLGTGWTLKDTNNLGEFDLAEMLRVNGVGTPTPADPSAPPVPPVVEGWGGAQYALYEGPSAAVVLLQTRWDSAKAAANFDSALRKSFAQATRDGDLWTDNGLIFGTKHSGDEVVYVGGTDRDVVTKVLEAVK